jgi:hypothetical protein
MTSGVNVQPACSISDYDPEWWTFEHPGRCHKGCAHGLASHICLSHCPLVKQCQDMASDNPDMWAGMVVGGMIFDARRSKRHWWQPAGRISCESCKPELALVS